MPEAINSIWILVCAALIMSMQVGFCMLEAGLVRSKNSINVAIKNLLDFCVAALLFWAFGFALMFGASATGWIGTSQFLPGAALAPDALIFLLFQLMFCATAATIVSGAVAERMSFSSYLIVTAIVSGIIYPIAGGWAWNPDGWLRTLGFRDFAGSTVVHSVGGWVALAAVIILGPRTGRFDTKNALVSSHSLVISTIGVLILFVGWFGFNGGSTFAFTGTVPLIILNTTLAGAAGCLVALSAVWWKKRLPELPATLNGCVGGLVAVTASCNAITPPEAVLIGAIGGLLSYLALFILEALRIDDVVGASAAHAVPGVWGTLAVGFLADPAILGTGLSPLAQFGVQLLGVSVYAIWAFGIGWLLLALANRLHPLRINADYERVGLNVSEHGASTEIIDLLNEMSRHSREGEFNQRLAFEPFTEVGQIASEYNRVIDKVIGEMEMREEIAERLQRARDDSENANRKIFSSLQYARRIQHAILPGPRQLRETLGDHFVLYVPRDLVSGDFYWCQQIDSHRFVAVVDCTGHGVPGAFMSMIGYLLLEHIIVEKRILEPAAILAEMHLRVRLALGQDSPEGAENRDGMEIALARIDPDEILFAGARRDLWWFQSQPGLPPFGDIPGDRHGLGGGPLEPTEIAFTQHALPRRDGLTIYLQTDGLVQQPNHVRAVYDHGRLRTLLSSLQPESLTTQCRQIAQSFEQFRGGAIQRDDVTVLGIRFSSTDPDTPPTVAARIASRENPSDPMPEGLLLSTTGPISSDVITECSRLLRERILLTMAERIELFGVFVEIAQNVAKHSADREPTANTGIGTVFVEHHGNTITVGSSNAIDPNLAETLRQRWEEILPLPPEALKSLYLERLHRSSPTSQPAGLGLIDLARKSHLTPEISFTPSKSGNLIFSIRIKLRHTPGLLGNSNVFQRS